MNGSQGTVQRRIATQTCVCLCVREEEQKSERCQCESARWDL